MKHKSTANWQAKLPAIVRFYLTRRQKRSPKTIPSPSCEAQAHVRPISKILIIWPPDMCDVEDRRLHTIVHSASPADGM